MHASYRYEVLSGNALDPGAPADRWAGIPVAVLAGNTRSVEINAWDSPLIFRMKYKADDAWGDDIEIDSDNQPIQYWFSAKEVQFTNKAAGAVARYQFVGMW